MLISVNHIYFHFSSFYCFHIMSCFLVTILNSIGSVLTCPVLSCPVLLCTVHSLTFLFFFFCFSSFSFRLSSPFDSNLLCRFIPSLLYSSPFSFSPTLLSLNPSLLPSFFSSYLIFHHECHSLPLLF